MHNFKDAHINIAGVVGVGKSSLCSVLEQYSFKIFKEPVVNNSLLAKFYADKKRYSLASQLFFLNKRFEMYKNCNSFHKSIIDRSLPEDGIFAKMLYETEQLDASEYEIYQEIFNNYLSNIQAPDLMIYLKIKPENAIQRIQKRGRSYELSQDPTYWYNLNNHYQAFFQNYSWSKLLTIQVDTLDFVSNPHDTNLILNIIQKALQQDRGHQTLQAEPEEQISQLSFYT